MPFHITLKKMVKAAHKKKNSPQTRIEKQRFFGYMRFSFLLVLIGVVSFAITHILITTHRQASPCANSKSCRSDLHMNIQNNMPGFFEGNRVIPPVITLADKTSSAVLGIATASGEKHIYVDLSNQTLYAYQGKTLFMKTLVSTGKWNPTPTGNFHIWEKLIATRMTGGEGADAYDLPNVPYVMYFYQDFGLHGAYWHDNFGHPMSHGCVNMRQVDSQALYEWADGPNGDTPGTEVSVCDKITSDNQCIQNNPIQ